MRWLNHHRLEEGRDSDLSSVWWDIGVVSELVEQNLRGTENLSLSTTIF